MLTVVIDSNVAAKTFSEEPDAVQGIALLRTCVVRNIRILVPDMFAYEIAAIANKKAYPIEPVLGFFRETMDALMDVRFPSADAWLQANDICQQGNAKSGYPPIYDSVYHAMAIIENGTDWEIRTIRKEEKKEKPMLSPEMKRALGITK